MERVSIIRGKKPILVVAPHGFDGDDERTAKITEHIAKSINCYAVINRGWERAENVDYVKDKADCNNVVHCHEDVVKEEFLEPILRFKNTILGNGLYALFNNQEGRTMYIYFIHGMGNKHRKLSGDDKLDMVVGYGAGSPNSYTCDTWRKDLFLHLLTEAGINAYEGKKGGPMSGWARNNMNQLFRKWYADNRIHSMQVEIIYDLRHDDDIAILTAEYLATAMQDMLDVKNFKAMKQYGSY